MRSDYILLSNSAIHKFYPKLQIFLPTSYSKAQAIHTNLSCTQVTRQILHRLFLKKFVPEQILGQCNLWTNVNKYIEHKSSNNAINTAFNSL